MSLKVFHVIFITAACVLAFGFGLRMLDTYRSGDGTTSDLVFGVCSLVVGAGLIVYEYFFLKKTKDIS